MFRLEPRPAPSKALTLLSPLIALAITVAVGTVLFLALGKDPVVALRLFFVEPLKSAYALSELSLKATPLVLIALGLSACFRANLWNIGAEGQFILGAVCAGGVAMHAKPETGAWVVLSGADPLNLVGILTPGPKLASLTGNRVLYRDGIPIALMAGGEVAFLETLDAATQWEAQKTLLRGARPPSLVEST